jgi:N-acetylglucosamine kinase-like BadF-type ATPase
LEHVIGIDSGATSSEAVIISFFGLNGAKLSQKKYPSINVNLLGVKESAKRLVHIIKDIVKSSGKGKILSVAAGVSGARYEKDRKELVASIKKSTSIKHVQVVPDTEIAFAAAFENEGKNRGILIAGTGSVLFYKDSKGKMNKIGGWGRHIGDEGSGHWIAREALYKVTKYYDGREKKSQLADVLKKEFNINPENIVKEVYQNGFEISRLTKHVFRCAENKDLISNFIIQAAAENLATHFLPLKKTKYVIALTGSLFSEETLLEKYLRKIVSKNFKNITLVKPSQQPVYGALKVAMTKVK